MCFTGTRITVNEFLLEVWLLCLGSQSLTNTLDSEFQMGFPEQKNCINAATLQGSGESVFRVASLGREKKSTHGFSTA